MRIPVRRLVIVFLTVLIIAGVTALALGKFTSLFGFRDNFCLKAVVIYIAIVPAFLLAWLCHSIPYLVGLSILFVGRTLNVVVGVANGGMFPASGYCASDFTAMEKSANYYFLADNSARLTILGDHAVLAGASVGDILALLGCLSIPVISTILSRRKARR